MYAREQTSTLELSALYPWLSYGSNGVQILLLPGQQTVKPLQ